MAFVVTVRVEVLPARWPDFSAAVRGRGVRSYLSAPLRIDNDRVGALNLCSVDDHGFRDLGAAY